MKKLLLIAICVLPLAAADVTVWTAPELKGFDKKLSGAPFKSEQLEKFGNHYTMVAHREANGSAEVHETEADLFVVQSGTATLQVGGKIVDGKTTAPNEIRGPSIEGGEKKKLSPGDIVHIPAKVPHQLLVDNGKNFTYFVMKVGGQ
jgi:mannose-6-phosphate isomerase-like protein (cupin superfamily)